MECLRYGPSSSRPEGHVRRLGRLISLLRTECSRVINQSQLHSAIVGFHSSQQSLFHSEFVRFQTSGYQRYESRIRRVRRLNVLKSIVLNASSFISETVDSISASITRKGWSLYFFSLGILCASSQLQDARDTQSGGRIEGELKKHPVLISSIQGVIDYHLIITSILLQLQYSSSCHLKIRESIHPAE